MKGSCTVQQDYTRTVMVLKECEGPLACEIRRLKKLPAKSVFLNPCHNQSKQRHWETKVESLQQNSMMFSGYSTMIAPSGQREMLKSHVIQPSSELKEKEGWKEEGRKGGREGRNEKRKKKKKPESYKAGNSQRGGTGLKPKLIVYYSCFVVYKYHVKNSGPITRQKAHSDFF